MEEITKNELKFFIKLHNKKFREEHALFLVQGRKLVEETIASIPDKIYCLLGDQENMPDIDVPRYKASKKDMGRLSTLSSAPDLIAVVRADFKLELPKTQWTIVLDEIKDPGNLGTLIRLADWFGIRKIVCSPNTVELLNPKVIQSTMGSIFRVEVNYTELNAYLSNCKVPIFKADLNGNSIYDVSFPNEGVLILGSESHGLVTTGEFEAAQSISIPGVGEAESLNVGVAGGIIVSHIFKGRI